MSGRPSRKRPSLPGSSSTDPDYDRPRGSFKRPRTPMPPATYLAGLGDRDFGTVPSTRRPQPLAHTRPPITNAAGRLPMLDHRLPARTPSSFNTSAIRSSAAPNSDTTQPVVDSPSAPSPDMLSFPRFPPLLSSTPRPPPGSQSSSHTELPPAGISPFQSAPYQPTPARLLPTSFSGLRGPFPDPQACQHFTNAADALKKSRAALDLILQNLPSYPLAVMSSPLYKVIHAHNKLTSWFVNYVSNLTQNCTCDADVEKEYFFAECKHRSCAACLRESGQCCKRNQSVFKAFFPQNDVCPICRDADNTMSILVCGHVVCTRCWDRMQRDNPLLLSACPICRKTPAWSVASYEPSITVALDAAPQLN